MSPTRGLPRRLPRHRETARLAVLAALLATAAGCSGGGFLRQGMPEPATREAERILSLWQGSWVAAWAVGALVWGLIIWAIIFHRKKSDELPRQVRYNLPIEVLYMVIPFILVSVLFYFAVQTETTLARTTQQPDVIVDVTGFQWSWKFDYQKSGVSVVGEPVSDYRQGPTLVIPRGERVRFNLRSEDVVHSFWVPAFAYKQDVVPGHPNQFEITATEEGTYAGRCSELCGTYHSRMLFTLEVVSPEEFQQFVENRQAQSAAEGSQ